MAILWPYSGSHDQPLCFSFLLWPWEFIPIYGLRHLMWWKAKNKIDKVLWHTCDMWHVSHSKSCDRGNLFPYIVILISVQNNKKLKINVTHVTCDMWTLMLSNQWSITNHVIDKQRHQHYVIRDLSQYS